MTAEYRFFLADLRSDRTLAEPELRDVRLNFALNGAGSWEAKMPLGSDMPFNPHDVTTPARTALWAERNGVLLYGGIVWSRRYKKSQRSFELSGSDFYSYLSHRFLSANRDYTGMTPEDIVQDLFDYMGTFEAGSIGMTPNFTSNTTIGTMDDLFIESAELHKIADLIGNLADEGAFDFAMDVRHAGGRREKILTLSHPDRGRRFGATHLVFDSSNVIDYEWPEDGTSVVNDVFAIGSGEGEDSVLARSQSEISWQEGYPRLQDDYSYPEVTSQKMIENLADEAIRHYHYPEVNLSVTLNPDRHPQVGSYIVGDEAEFRMKDERFPEGIRVRQRITDIQVTPPQDDKGETVSVSMGGPMERLP